MKSGVIKAASHPRHHSAVCFRLTSDSTATTPLSKCVAPACRRLASASRSRQSTAAYELNTTSFAARPSEYDGRSVRSSEVTGEQRLALLKRVQRRAGEGVPYLPIWVVTPVAWAQPGLRAPLFDGSGRVVLSALRAEGGQP